MGAGRDRAGCSTRLFDHQEQSFSLPGSQSQAALELLGQTFPTLSNAQATAVSHVADGTLTSGSNTQLIDQPVTTPRGIDQIAAVGGPSLTAGQSGDVSSDGTIAYLTVLFDEPADDLFVQHLLRLGRRRRAGTRRRLAGGAFRRGRRPAEHPARRTIRLRRRDQHRRGDRSRHPTAGAQPSRGLVDAATALGLRHRLLRTR